MNSRYGAANKNQLPLRNARVHYINTPGAGTGHVSRPTVYYVGLIDWQRPGTTPNRRHVTMTIYDAYYLRPEKIFVINPFRRVPREFFLNVRPFAPSETVRSRKLPVFPDRKNAGDTRNGTHVAK